MEREVSTHQELKINVDPRKERTHKEFRKASVAGGVVVGSAAGFQIVGPLAAIPAAVGLATLAWKIGSGIDARRNSTTPGNEEIVVFG